MEATVTAIMALADIIEDTARESMPMGAPSGHVYAALMSVGVNLSLYNGILAVMQSSGRIVLDGNLIRVPA